MFEDWPVGWLYLFFLSGAIARSQFLYWLGRGAVAGARRTKLQRIVESRHLDRARSAIEKWGMPIIPASFLTIGFQSAVQSSAGLLKIAWLRYTLWCIPGWLMWALVYTTGGTVVIWAFLETASHSPWTAVALGILVIGGVAFAIARNRRRRLTRLEGEAAVGQSEPTQTRPKRLLKPRSQSG